MTGRPTAYTPEIGATICERMAEGESLRAICRDDGMPGISSVMRWLFDPLDDSDPRVAFREQYARARQAQAEGWAEEIVSIADSTADDVNRDRLRVDSRKWISSRLLPRVYGDRTILEGGDNPIRTEDVSDPVKVADRILQIFDMADRAKK